MTLIGLDFSINKPAACVFHNGEYFFYGWPYDLKPQIFDTYINNGVNLVKRTDDKIKGDTISEQMRYQIKNSLYLSKLIRETLAPHLNINTYLAFEGLSYGSSGDMVVQLGGYKYMLMNELSNLVPLENMFTYSPITVKSVAGCAKRGMGKSDMINAFIKSNISSEFRNSLEKNPELFQTKKSNAWVTHVDDMIDAFWVLKTLQTKEHISI